jgi:hypothetical protein
LKHQLPFISSIHFLVQQTYEHAKIHLVATMWNFDLQQTKNPPSWPRDDINHQIENQASNQGLKPT